VAQKSLVMVDIADNYVQIVIKCAHHKDALAAFRREISVIPEVQYAVLLMGAFDYDLHIVVRDIDHYQTLLSNKLVSLPGVKEMESSVVLEVVKKTNALPI
ncbi:MAG: Lrp/AsnC ligand binding domain-containing protein, partial [Pseudomonadota bacterium]